MTEILPLTGVRIVDISQIGAGPYATSLLGDLGADVVKVEPLQGDSFRYVDENMGQGDSAYFFGVNRSKRSIALDLKTPEGHAALLRLVADADVFVVAFRPDAVARMGLDYDTLHEINPRLVYASLTAFGESGPRAGQPGMDILAQSISGMMGITGEPDRQPVKVGAPIADFVGSFFLGFAICAAIRQRDQVGYGDKVSINLLDGQIAALANFITAYDKTGVPFRPQGGGHPQLVPYQTFLGSDDRYFILACLNDKFWAKLAPVLGDDAFFADRRFARNSGRVAHRVELCSRLQSIFATRPAEYWLDHFDGAGVPCGPVHRLEDALTDPQVLANESVTRLNHPQYGEYLVPNNPIRFRNAATGPRGYAPGLGEHTVEVLAEAGYSPDEIDTLFDAGAVGGDRQAARIATPVR